MPSFPNLDFASLSNTIYFGNTLQRYVMALMIWVAVWLALTILRQSLIRLVSLGAKHAELWWDKALTKALEDMHTWFPDLLGLTIALMSLNLPPLLSKFVSISMIALLVVETIHLLSSFLESWQNHLFKLDKTSAGAMTILKQLVLLAIWLLGGLVILSNTGVNITSLLAGLGIGGIAVALAVQNVLTDLFSSVAIYLDKPFVPGDFIVVGTESGTVEKIGIKTTRLRSLSGEMIVIANKDLTSARIKNFRSMKSRRVVNQIGIGYDTSRKQLQAIPNIMESIVKSLGEKVEFQRAHLHEFGASALMYEIVFTITDRKYEVYMDIQQQFLQEVLREFSTRKIQIAYPTQQVIVKR